MKTGTLAIATSLAVLVSSINTTAAILAIGRDYSGFDEDTTTVVYGTGGTSDAAYYYGFEVAPTSTTVDLDGVPDATVGDFHTLNAPTFDTVAGIAHNAGANGGESLLRTDFGNSLWRQQFLNSDWTVEAKINLLDTGTEGSEGVFGLFQGNNLGRLDLRIGTDSIRDDIAGTDLVTGMDNTGWHVWRVSLTNNTFYVFRDGMLATDPIPAAGTGTNNRNFAGDYSSTLSGDWEMEYYVIDTSGTIPEPTSSALLALGGLALLRRRR